MTDAKVIIIDDNAAVLKTLKMVLSNAFTKVVAVPDPKVIPALIAHGDVDVVLLDMNFGKGRLDGSDGLFWLNRIKEESHLEQPPAVVLITAFGDIDLAVDSLKRGADDFVQKPWSNERLVQVLTDAVEKRRLRYGQLARDAEHDERRMLCALVEMVVKRYAMQYGRPTPEVGADAVEALLAIAQKGKLAELEETIERTMLMTTGSVWRATDIVCVEDNGKAGKTTLSELEAQLIESVLRETDHNLVLAAQQLGISRQTLYNKMKRHGID